MTNNLKLAAFTHAGLRANREKITCVVYVGPNPRGEGNAVWYVRTIDDPAPPDAYASWTVEPE